MPEDSMNLEDLARYTSLSTAPVKSIQAALDFEQAMHQVQEQNLDGFYANIEQVNKDLLHMADEQESAKRETMKWSKMTPEQRDRLIHERVMGHSPDEPCNGIFWAATNTQTGERGCQCSGCGAYYPVDDTIEYYKHQQPNAPAYTTDLNAAWQIVESEKFMSVEMYYQARWHNETKKVRVYECTIHTYDQGSPVSSFGSTMSEAVCLAALRACGVEIEV